MNQPNNKNALFISHAEEDVEEARRLYEGLKRAGLDPWLKEENLLPGQKVDVEIRRAIGRSRFFLALLSENSVKRGSVNKELAQALTIIDEFPESDIFIIPVRLDDCTPTHEKLQKLAPVDMFPEWDKGFGKILDAIESGAGRKTISSEKNPQWEPKGAGEGGGRAQKQEDPGKTFGNIRKGLSLFVLGILIILLVAFMGNLYLGKDHLLVLHDRDTTERREISPPVGRYQSPNIHVSGDLTGNTTIHYYGVSEERLQKLSEEFGVTKSALKNFFKILEQKQVPLEDLDSTLRQIAQRYKELQKKLEEVQSDDPVLAKLKTRVKKALETGDFDLAEKLLNEASEIDIQAANRLMESGIKRLLSAAASKAENGDLANTRLDYKKAAAYFQEAAELLPEGSDELILAGYLRKRGDACYDAGNYTQAGPHLNRSLEIREKILGSGHEEVGDSINSLAILYEAQGRYEEAEFLCKRSLAIAEKTLGSDHPFFAATLNNLAALYQNQGKYEKAEPLFKRSLAIMVKNLGLEHPSLAATLNNLAALYQNQGKYEKAEPLYKRSLAIEEKVLGLKHSSLGTTLNNLAGLYETQGRFKEAEPLLKRSLAINEKVLGPEHPELAATMNNLAALYVSQGKYEEAQPLYKRSLAIYEKVLGPEHPKLAITLNNLAELYRQQGRYEEAESLHKRTLAIYEKVLGPEHPFLAATLNNLAVLYESQGRYEEAEPLYKRTLAIYEKVLGPEHPSLAKALNNLANLYRGQGRYEEAEPLYKRSLTIYEKALEPEHPSLATALGNLAGLYESQGRYEEAEPLYKRDLAITEKVFGPEHPKLAITLNNLAVLYKSQGKYEEAEPLLKRSLTIARKALDPAHPDVVRIKTNIAAFYQLWNKSKEGK